MSVHPRRVGRSSLLLTLSLLGLIASAVVINNTDATGFPTSGSPSTVPMGSTLVSDSNIRFFDAAPAVGTGLTNDTRIKFVDANFLGHWVQGDAVLYDTNNNGKYDFGEPWIGGRAPTVGQSLTSDSKIKFVDTSLNGVWDQGETVVYERNGGNTYALGDAVIGAIPPTVGGGLTTDPKVKYVDSGSLGHWIQGDAVLYDSNSTGHYANNTDFHLKYVDTLNLGHWASGDAVIYHVSLSNSTYSIGDKNLTGSAPGLGTTLKFDKLVKFLDPTKKGYWIQGDAIVYDSPDNNNVYESGEPIIVNSSPLIGTTLGPDPKISYVDSGNLGHWVPGDVMIYDSNSNGFFDASIDPWVMYYNSSGASHWVPGETVVYDADHDRVYSKFGGDKIINGTSLPDMTPLTFDSKIRMVDPDLNGHWDTGEPVLYDADNGTSDGNIYVSADTVINPGNPGLLFLGVSLTEPVLFGTAPPVGTAAKVDPKMKYVETNGNTIWENGEAIIYDNNTNNIYDSGDTVVIGSPPIAGSILHNPLIAGANPPPVGTLLKTDPSIKIAATAGPWSLGIPVVYDASANYDPGAPVIAGGAAPSGIWTQGEGVFYDSDSATNSTLSLSDPVVNGTSPLPGTPVRYDSHIKFVDSNSLGHWVAGDTVAYDSNNSNLYVPGDIIIAGTAPAPLNVLMPVTALDPLGRIWLTWNEKPYGATRGTQVYYKIWNGTAWSTKQLIVNDPANVVDNGAFPLALPNQTMMIFWASNKTGHFSIFYRSYNAALTNPVPTSNPVQLTNSNYPDKSASATTDRFGRIWVSWARQNTTLSCVLICSNVYYKYYNGTSWSTDFLLPPAANPTLSELTPSISHTNDGKIWIFWATAPATVAGTYNIAEATTDGTIQTLPTTGIPSGSWASNQSLVAEGTDIDQPSMVQSRDGTLWLFYQSNDPINPNQYIHYVNSTDLRTWNGPYSLTANSNDGSPTAVQMTDHRIWIFWGRNSNLSQIDYTTSNLITNVYHLGIQQITLGTRLVRSGWSAWINVTVTNNGDFTETGLLKVTLNSTVIETTNQTFTSGASYLLNYNWTGRVGFWGRYILNATLQPAFAESTGNRGDENWSMGLFRISPPGDVDGNGVVNILDAADLSIVYGQPASNYPYDDIDRDAKPGSLIDILDAATLALYYGAGV